METLWVVSPVKGLLTWDWRTGEYAVNPPEPEPEPSPGPTPAPSL